MPLVTKILRIKRGKSGERGRGGGGEGGRRGGRRGGGRGADTLTEGEIKNTNKVLHSPLPPPAGTEL